MKKFFVFAGIVVAAAVSAYLFEEYQASTYEEMTEDASFDEVDEEAAALANAPVVITPISHATFVLDLLDVIIYNDPVGDRNTFNDHPSPNLILISDIHGDHLSVETLEAVVAPDTIIVAPQAVADEFTEGLLTRTQVLANGETTSQSGITIEALPMYNLPESSDSGHIKGRGNGYVLEKDGLRVYIAGDTADIPEMRALQNIDLAFVPMNLPYTMSVEDAADAVLDFAPATVYPYHYRGQDGLSDIERFKRIVSEENPNIEVVLLNWYPS